jgi:hypothetical protein
MNVRMLLEICQLWCLIRLDYGLLLLDTWVLILWVEIWGSGRLPDGPTIPNSRCLISSIPDLTTNSGINVLVCCDCLWATTIWLQFEFIKSQKNRKKLDKKESYFWTEMWSIVSLLQLITGQQSELNLASHYV